MVKTPKTRHSRPRREPVTIELEPGEVSRIEKAAEQPDQAEIATPNREAAAEQAAHASQAVDDAGASGMVEAKAANLQEDMPAEPAVEPAENSHPQDGGAESVSAQSDPAFGETPLREDGEGMFDAASQPSSAQDRDSAPRPSAGEKRSGLGTVAAGIIGGVIALAGAGASAHRAKRPSRTPAARSPIYRPRLPRSGMRVTAAWACGSTISRPRWNR